MESRESSSPIVTRSVAAALQGEFAEGYGFTWIERWGLRLLGVLPRQVAGWLVPQSQRSSGLDPKVVTSIKAETLINNRLADYRNLKQTFPGVVVGVAQGGATAHLARLIGGPFLPQAFVLTLKGGSPFGEAEPYYQLSGDLARKITDRNPEFISIQHFDPVHDGWLTRQVNHLRLKLTELPEPYRDFIRTRVAPGGDVVYLDGGASWLRQKVGERNYFQAGGWGAIPAEEFYYGSQRLEAYAAREKLKASAWRLPEFEVQRGPESEWGSEAGLGASLQAFCQREGYRFIHLRFDDPNQFSLLAFLAYRQFLEMQDIQPSGAIVEMFSQFDASAVHQAGLLPIWLIFNTSDSLSFLKTMLTYVPNEMPLYFSALSTFSMTPDMVQWQDWMTALHGRSWINAGARGSHYPADTAALLDWRKPLLQLCRQKPVQAHGRMSGQQLEILAKEIKHAAGSGE
jgi:hypothetical protein